MSPHSPGGCTWKRINDQSRHLEGLMELVPPILLTLAVLVLWGVVHESAPFCSDTTASRKLKDHVEPDQHQGRNDQRRYQPDV